MGKEITTQFQEVQRVPYKINRRRNASRRILITLAKIKFKEKDIKRSRRKEKQRKYSEGFKLVFQKKIGRPEGSGRIYLK